MLAVRPTIRGWILLASGMFWFVVALINQALMPLVFACATLALVASGLVGALLALRGLRVRRGAVGDAATGQAVSLPLIVINDLQRCRQTLVVHERLPFTAEPEHSTIVEGLLPREQRVVGRRVLAMKRGEFELACITLRGGDPAGLFCRERRIVAARKLFVMPGTEPVAELPLGRKHAVAAIAGTPLSAAGTSQEFYGVREYNPADGLRYIHWKSSARTGRLTVREFERNAVMSVALFVDAHEHFVSGAEHWSNLEYQIRAAASICVHLAGLYCNLAFAAGGARPVLLPASPAAEAKDRILLALTALKPGRVPLTDLIFDLAATLPRNTAVYCLSLAAPRPLAEALNVLTLEGMTVRWFCADRDRFALPNADSRRATRTRVGPGTLPPIEAAQLHPGMPLGRALTLGG